MPYATPYHDWPVPRDGEENPPDGTDGPLQSVGSTESWGDILQTLADHLDGDIVRMGTEANRPASPAAPENTDYLWYLSVDTEEIRIYDVGADTWTGDITGSGGVTVSDSGTTILDPATGIDFGAFLNVTDNGDGTVTVDVPDNWLDAAGDTLGGVLDMGGNNLEDGTVVIWDATNGYVPASSVEDAWVDAAGDTMSGALTISTGGTGLALDLSTGDLVNVDDLNFSNSANPQIGIPNASGASLRVQDTFNGATARTYNEGGPTTEHRRLDLQNGYILGGYEVVHEGEWTASGATSTTFSLSTAYDYILVDFRAIEGSNTALTYLRLQVNGATSGGYDFITSGGSRVTGENHWRCGYFDPSAQQGGGTLKVDGRFSGRSCACYGPIGVGSGGNDLQSGKQNNITSPLTQLTMFWSSGSITLDATVYGVGL